MIWSSAQVKLELLLVQELTLLLAVTAEGKGGKKKKKKYLNQLEMHSEHTSIFKIKLKKKK